jgi:hypothetical protein
MKRVGILILIFVMCLYPVSAANMYNYVYNGSSWVPALSTADGQQKYWIDMANASYGDVQYNLSIGEKVKFDNGGNLFSNATSLFFNNGSLTTDLRINNLPENAVVSFNQATCPAGWVLADGTSGTPDLRGIFVRGAGVSGSYQMANGSYFDGGDVGDYMNDSFQGHYHSTYPTSQFWVREDSSPSWNLGATQGGGDDSRYSGAPIRGPTTAGAEYGVPRTGTETAPASYALIYCVKTAEDSAASNSIWQTIGDLIQPVNSSKKLIARANGIGIDTLTNFAEGANLTTAYNDELVTLNSSASGNAVFKLPTVTSANDGEIYRFLNDAEYVMTIKPNDTSAVWNSGSGYGIDLPDKGTMVSLRYDSSRNKWDILQKTGGKVLIEGLKLMEPLSSMTPEESGSAGFRRFLDKTLRHDGRSSSSGVQFINTGKYYPIAPDFNGAAGQIIYSDSTDWDIFGTNTTGHKTVAGWVYHDGLGSAEHYLSQYEDATNYYRIFKQSANTIRVVKNTEDSIDMNIIDSSSLSATTWYHVALVIDGSDVGLYVNGTQIGYDGSWDTDTLTGNLFVGQNGANAQYLDGRMQDLHISYNNPYNANPNSGSTDSFTIPAAPFKGVMN